MVVSSMSFGTRTVSHATQPRVMPRGEPVATNDATQATETGEYAEVNGINLSTTIPTGPEDP